MKKLLTLSITVLAIGTLFTSCEKKINDTIDDIKANVPHIEMDMFKAKIDSAFGPNTTGYGWAAFIDGAAVGSGAGGWARLEGYDSDPVKYSPNTVSTIFSTSKTITAAVAMRLMENKNISIDSKMINYLPTRWSKDTSLNRVTFKDLMGHKSGMTGTFDGITSMKNKVAAGRDVNYGNEVYANINYTLFRIIIPFMVDKPFMDGFANEGDAKLIDMCAISYEASVGAVMDIIHVPNSDKIDTDYWSGDKKTLYYNNKNLTAGLEMFDCHDVSGAGGWFMTPAQYAFFIDRLMADKIVEKDNLDMMKNEELGMYQIGGKNGVYYWHNGGSRWDGTGRGGGCIWMYFPVNKMSFFIQYNSKQSPEFPSNDRALIAKLFDESYFDK